MKANPEAYLTRVKDVAAVDKSRILLRIAQHYVRESEVEKAEVAANCASKVLDGQAGRGIAELKKDIRKLLGSLYAESSIMADKHL